MTNEQYLNTLITCGKLKWLKTEDYDILRKEGYDLDSTVNHIQRLVNKNEDNLKIENVIFGYIIGILKNYEGEETNFSEYMESFKRFLNAYFKVFSSNSRDIKEICNLNNRIGPMEGLKGCKIHIWTDLGLNGIEIYNGVTNWIEVSNLDNTLGIFRRVITKDDYDLMILPRLDRDKKEVYDRYLELFSDASVGEYLNLITLIEGWRCGIGSHEQERIENYKKIRKRDKVKAIDVKYFIRELINSEVYSENHNNILRLLRLLVEKDDTTKDRIDEFKRLMVIKREYLWFDSINLEEISEKESLEEMITYLKENGGDEIDNIEIIDDILRYKEKNPDKRYVIVDEDGELKDYESEAFGIRVDLKKWGRWEESGGGGELGIDWGKIKDI